MEKMNLSCIFSRKSPLNFPIATSRARPPTFKLAADFAQRLPEFKFLAAGFPFTGFFTFPIYEYYGRFKGFRSGHFKIRLALSLIFPAGDCSVDGRPERPLSGLRSFRLRRRLGLDLQ